MIAQSVLPFYQILFEVHNCLTLPRIHRGKDRGEIEDVRGPSKALD